MQITHDATINASPRNVVQYMLSDAFYTQLCKTLDAVTQIEEIERSQITPTQLTRILRYKAPTASKIPIFLNKYKDKAPPFVHWQEIATWDLANNQMQYKIEPEIPEKWHSYYNVHGQLQCHAHQGKTQLAVSLTYNVNVFGLKRLIERALRVEVEQMLKVQAEIVQQHFLN